MKRSLFRSADLRSARTGMPTSQARRNHRVAKPRRTKRAGRLVLLSRARAREPPQNSRALKSAASQPISIAKYLGAEQAKLDAIGRVVVFRVPFEPRPCEELHIVGPFAAVVILGLIHLG